MTWQEFVKKLDRNFNVLRYTPLENLDEENAFIELKLEQQFLVTENVKEMVSDRSLFSYLTIKKNGNIFLTKNINISTEQFLIGTNTWNYAVDIHLGRYNYTDAYKLVQLVFKGVK